jgi:hypothetical protein
MPRSSSNPKPPIEGDLDIMKGDFIDYAKFNKPREGLEIGDKVNKEDVKRLEKDFADVFSTFRNLKPTPPYEYNYCQYQTFLASLRLARIECFVLDFFIKFSNGRSMNTTDRGDNLGAWAKTIDINRFFQKNGVFQAFESARTSVKEHDALKHNMKMWLKISHYVLTSQLDRYTNSAISLTCISLQDIFKMMIPLFDFHDTTGSIDHCYAPMQFNQNYLLSIGLAIGSMVHRRIIRKVSIDVLFNNMISRFGLQARIKKSVHLLLGIHGEDEDEGTLRFSIKDVNAAHSEHVFGKTREKYLQNFHNKVGKTRKRFGDRKKEIQVVIDRECTSQHQLNEGYKAFKYSCREAGFPDEHILGPMYTKVMKRVQVLLYKHYDIEIPSSLSAYDFDVSVYDNVKFKKIKAIYDNDNADDKYSDGDEKFSNDDKMEKWVKDPANKKIINAMAFIYNFYSVKHNFDDRRRLFMMQEEQRIKTKIESVINATVVKTVGHTRSHQNLYK